MSTPLSYVEISRPNLLHNLKMLRTYLAPGVAVAAVVKGNAYGHGLREVVSILDGMVEYFQVDDIEELRALRAISQTPALVFGYVQPSDLAEAVQLGCELTIYDLERLSLLQEIAEQTGKAVRIHIKIDAYLGRQGIMLGDLDHFITSLKQHHSLVLAGVYSHFANIEDTEDTMHARKQIEALRTAVETFRNAGYTSVRTHLSSTSGLLVHDRHSAENFLVRIGIGLYGLYPSQHIRLQHQSKLDLKPVLSWKTHIAQTKWVPEDYPIGYGLSYVTPEPTNLAIIPQGYSDGLDRGLSNNGSVLVHGRQCAIIGRVAMNMVAIGVSHLREVKAGDEVVIIGTQGTHQQTAEMLAERLGTINYEVVTRISPHLPRLIVEE